MPWRDPNTWANSSAFTAAVGAVFGTLIRMGEQMLAGERERFWSTRLVVDALGLVVMITVSAGVAEYMQLGPWATSAVAVVLGRGGPPLIDRLVDRFTVRRKGA